MSEPTALGGIQDHDALDKNIDHGKVLTEEQAECIYKEIDPTSCLSLKVKDKSRPKEENAYKESIVIETSKKAPKQMEEWSILRDHVKYVQHNESDTLYNLIFGEPNYRQNRSLMTQMML